MKTTRCINCGAELELTKDTWTTCGCGMTHPRLCAADGCEEFATHHLTEVGKDTTLKVHLCEKHAEQRPFSD